ncbi:telomerase reverse transcriptase-like [Centruroides vittatus]|uniref:telomerase reverse transcriptase-like n=1 Tax=Centruroides vittatus TaxID=120091 RepID=UPI00350ECBC2
MESSNFTRNKQNFQKIILDESIGFICNDNFEELHKMIGDQLFYFLLTKCSLFEFVKDNCFIQRIGTPLQTLYRENIKKLNNNQKGNKSKVKIFHQHTKEKVLPKLEYIKKKKRRGKKYKKYDRVEVENKYNAVNVLVKKLKFNFSIEIPRYFIFHCKKFREQFPGNGNLSYALGLNDDVRKMLAVIFSTEEDNLVNILNENQYTFLQDQITAFIRNHRTCPFKRFLKSYCDKKFRKDYIVIPYLLEQHLSEKEIMKFIHEILKYTISPLLLGTRNYRLFLKRIKILIRKGKNDVLRLHQVFHGMKTKECKWLKNEKNIRISSFLFGKILNWLLIYVLCILQGFFYVSESGIHKRKLFFYRKSLWQKIQTLSINEFLRQKNLILISVEQVRRLCREGQCLGISNARFIPKSASLRPIFNLQKKSNMNVPDSSSLLQKITSIFDLIKSQHATLLGCAKETSIDVYHAWKLFCRQRQIRNQLYFVKMDLQDCFGSMNQDKLLEIVQDVFKKFGESCYQIRKYYILYEEKEKIKLKFVRCASFVSETFFQYILKSRKNIRNAVFINLGTEEYLDLNTIFRDIKIYVTNCIVKIGKIYYRLNKGISQGGSLSMMLCNLYLAALEKECLSEFGKNSEELLMRFVDDFIFITPFKDRADHFMKIMMSGLIDFNLQVNPNKIIVNFSTEAKSVTVLENEEKLKWLGLLINPNTLNVSVDYTRYFGLSIGYSMSIDLKNAGYNLKKKMLALVVLRFLPITLDTYINTEDVVIVNLFESFLLLAYRMHHVIKNWQSKRRMQNPLFLLDIIIQCAHTLYLKCCFLVKQNIMEFSMKKLQMQWLCLQAFRIKFEKHYEMYKPLLKIMKKNCLLLKISKKKKLKWKKLFKNYPNHTFELIFD